VTVAERSGSLLILHRGTNEQQLIEAARSLSPEAWSAIYDTNFPKIYNYVYRRLEDHAAAEDLASHVFLEALRGIARFNYRGVSLLAWLYRIAHNLTCDHLRRNAARPVVHLGNGNGSHEPQVSDACEQVDTWQDISRALRRLPDDQQQVLILRFIEGLPVATVAVIMGKRVGTVRVIQHRALGHMRRLLADPRKEK
jgi:RNA polymerase sigma-70 factor (ECF subfamily)